MKLRKLFCRAIRVPAFVLPVLILINIYIIMRETTCSVEREDSRTVQVYPKAIQNNEEISAAYLRNQKRLLEIEKVCQQYSINKTFRNMKMSGEGYVTPDKNLLYCVIPKAGCTAWKQIIRFNTHDYEGRTVSSPNEIDRIYAHFGPWNKTKIYPMSNKTQLDYLNDAQFKFMFTRDPYRRLWSGYLDKLFLADFWWWLGTKIIAEIRPNANTLSKKCGHDVTFSEFLEFTVDHLRKKKHVDMHFEPAYRRCNPCQIQFDAVGKMETFTSDLKLITDVAKLKTGIDTADDKDDARALDEVKMLTAYNFDIQKRLTRLGKNEDCYNQVEIASRIWQTFQYNGYLSKNEEFPEEEFANMENAELIKQSLITKLIEIRKRTSADELKRWQHQREEFLKKAYDRIPLSLKKGIEENYKLDFELFQYDKEPKYVFN